MYISFKLWNVFYLEISSGKENDLIEIWQTHYSDSSSFQFEVEYVSTYTYMCLHMYISVYNTILLK